MVPASVDSGTVWPPTNPPATAARKKGHGLLGETAMGWDGARSSGMGLNPEKHRIIGLDCERTQLEVKRRTWRRFLYLRVYRSFGGIWGYVN
jgi:hypothetical protein